ncbi:MAG TPA: ferric reductase-like transmembrane domain-containing protein [Acidimicrobiia bacterium]|nr:ferric reductase-like transmembrane domain-containing protein [Acidimicrobiia bacterium]
MAIWWYVARASGLVAWILLTFTVVWGILLSTKVLGRRPTPAWLLDLHRFVGGATVVFVGVHLAAIFLDSFVHFDLVALFVPFASAWNPAAVAWGIVALYLLVAVEITSLLRRSLPNRFWRRVHYASFPLFAVATIHGLTAGTDSRTTFAVMVVSGAVLCVGLLTATRLGRAIGSAEPVRAEPVRAAPPPVATIRRPQP